MSYDKEDLAQQLKDYETELSTGHYLDRAITLAMAIDATDYEYLLRANQTFLLKNSKPAGLDQLLGQFHRLAVSICKRVEMTDEQIKPLAWAVSMEILERYELTHLRDDNRDDSVCNDCN